MDVIVFPDQSFGASLSSLKESTQLLIAQANSELDELLPNLKLRCMLVDELKKAHQIVQGCERQGGNGPYQSENQEVDDWGNPIEEGQEEAIAKFITSADIQRAINVRQQMNVLKEIFHGDKQQIFEIAKLKNELFDQDQLEIILKITEPKRAPKPLLLQRLRHQPQLLAMVLAFTNRKFSVQQYLWSICRQSRKFLDRYTQQTGSPIRERWSLENKFLTHYLVEWSNSIEQLHAIYFKHHERKLEIVLSQYRDRPNYHKNYIEPVLISSQTIFGDRFIRSLCYTSLAVELLVYRCMLCKLVLDAYITTKRNGQCIVSFRNLLVKLSYITWRSKLTPNIQFSFGQQQLQEYSKTSEIAHDIQSQRKEENHEFIPLENYNGTSRERQETFSLGIMIQLKKQMISTSTRWCLIKTLQSTSNTSQFETSITKRIVSFICYSLSSDPVLWQVKRNKWLSEHLSLSKQLCKISSLV
ncbi:hypothetical protein FGO68_gene7142 [Halteria grandinella]|uniref:Uncharacterized protein n=1 Tax=Halteria grandinella TaxID=5974 RepID=A0A8J8NRU0_HALGN|nr:hypothetical protein FGO68_gene7142 [Halteria grandinella]